MKRQRKVSGRAAGPDVLLRHRMSADLSTSSASVDDAIGYLSQIFARTDTGALRDHEVSNLTDVLNQLKRARSSLSFIKQTLR